MLVSTRLMSRAHALHDYYPAVSFNGKLLERVTTAKILGVHMDEHLRWVDHVTALLYPLMQHWRFTGNGPTSHNHVRKQLVESLVMS